MLVRRTLVFCSLLLVASSLVAGQHILRVSSTTGLDAAVAAAGGSVVSRHDGAGIAVVSGLTDEAASSLKGVIEAVPDADIEVRLGTPTVSDDDNADMAAHAAPNTATFFPRQWHLRAIGAHTAWAAGRVGSPNVTVAILDTGISYEHPDLMGLVDLSRSVSFVPSDDALVNTFFPGKHHVTDLNFHGTHVAATVASNAHAAAGVTQRVTLMGVKVLNVNGSGAFSGIISGLLHAADNGADVANMSLGADFPRAGNGRFIAYLQTVLNYAARQGMLVVVAAGNSAIDLDHDGNNYNSFCSAANVVCISATGPTAAAGTNGPWTNVDAPTGYSNYGSSSIHVAAPGGTGPGRVWAACSKTSLVVPVCQTGTFIVGVTGTSMASPHAAGLAALLVEDIGANRPSQVRAAMAQSADDLGKPGTDPHYGKGRINVPAALNIP